MNVFIALSCFAALALNALIINALLRRDYKKYFLLFCYVTVLFATNVIDTALYFDNGSWAGPSRLIAWTNQAIRQGLLYVVVISLVYRAMMIGRQRATVRRWLIVGSVLYAGGSLWLLQDPKLSRWMTDVISKLSFGAAVMTLGLWAVLLKNRTRDRQLLLLTGGLGLQITGEAIGQAMRQLYELSRLVAYFGNFVLIVSHLLCLFVWWQALRSVPADGSQIESGGRRGGTGRRRRRQAPVSPAPKSLTYL